MFTNFHYESTQKDDSDLCNFELQIMPKEIMHVPEAEMQQESVIQSEIAVSEMPLLNLVENDECQEKERSTAALNQIVNISDQFLLGFADSIYLSVDNTSAELDMTPESRVQPESLIQSDIAVGEMPLLNLVENDVQQEKERRTAASNQILNVSDQFSSSFADSIYLSVDNMSAELDMTPQSGADCAWFKEDFSGGLDFGDGLSEDPAFSDLNLDDIFPSDSLEEVISSEEACFAKGYDSSKDDGSQRNYPFDPMLNGSCQLLSSLLNPITNDSCGEISLSACLVSNLTELDSTTASNQISNVSDQNSSGFTDGVHPSMNDMFAEPNVMPASLVDYSSTSRYDAALSEGLGDGLSGGLEDSGFYVDNVCPKKSPEQVNSGETHFPKERDSLKELVEKIRRKHGNLKGKLFAKEVSVLLDNVFAKIVNLTGKPEERDQAKMIEQLLSFEKILDRTKIASDLLQTSIQNLHELRDAPTTCEPEEVVNEAGAKHAETVPRLPRSGRTVGVPVTGSDPVVMKALKIETRQMSPADDCASATFNSLCLRLPMSEKCRPVQSTEEDLRQQNKRPVRMRSAECMESMENLKPEIKGLDQDAEQMQELNQQPMKPTECIGTSDDQTLKPAQYQFDFTKCYLYVSLMNGTNDAGSAGTDVAFAEAGPYSYSHQERCHISSFTEAQPETGKLGKVQKDIRKPPDDKTTSKPVQEMSLKTPAIFLVDPKNPTTMSMVMNLTTSDNVHQAPFQSQPNGNAISYPAMFSPNMAVAEDCMNRLSLQHSSTPAQHTWNTTSQLPQASNLVSYLPSKKSIGKRPCPFENDESQDIVTTSAPPQTESFSTLIPTMVDEINNGSYKEILRCPKKKPRTNT